MILSLIVGSILVVVRCLFVAETHFLVMKYIDSRTDLPDYIRQGEVQAYKRDVMNWKVTFDLGRWRIEDFYPEYGRHERQ